MVLLGVQAWNFLKFIFGNLKVELKCSNLRLLQFDIDSFTLMT